MSNGIDFRIICVVLTEQTDGSPCWIVVTNDGGCTVFDRWARVPAMVRNWLSEHNNIDFCVSGSVVLPNAV